MSEKPIEGNVILSGTSGDEEAEAVIAETTVDANETQGPVSLLISESEVPYVVVSDGFTGGVSVNIGSKFTVDVQTNAYPNTVNAIAGVSGDSFVTYVSQEGTSALVSQEASCVNIAYAGDIVSYNYDTESYEDNPDYKGIIRVSVGDESIVTQDLVCNSLFGPIIKAMDKMINDAVTTVEGSADVSGVSESWVGPDIGNGDMGPNRACAGVTASWNVYGTGGWYCTDSYKSGSVNGGNFTVSGWVNRDSIRLVFPTVEAGAKVRIPIWYEACASHVVSDSESRWNSTKTEYVTCFSTPQNVVVIPVIGKYNRQPFDACGVVTDTVWLPDVSNLQCVTIDNVTQCMDDYHRLLEGKGSIDITVPESHMVEVMIEPSWVKEIICKSQVVWATRSDDNSTEFMVEYSGYVYTSMSPGVYRSINVETYGVRPVAPA